MHASLSRYADEIELDPARLGQVEARLNLIHSLKRKYGGALASVILFGEEARNKAAALEGRDAELTRLNPVVADVGQPRAIRPQTIQHARRNQLAIRHRPLHRLIVARQITRCFGSGYPETGTGMCIEVLAQDRLAKAP